MSASSRLYGLAKKNGNSPRGKKRQKPFALAISQQHAVQKIVWPVELTRHKTSRRTITIPQAAFDDLPPLLAHPLDIRHHIYSLMLQDAGKQQHIFCPSISRRGIPTALQLRYLLSKRCCETSTLSCGHYECDHGDQNTERGSLADFVALMLTCKFAYAKMDSAQ